MATTAYAILFRLLLPVPSRIVSCWLVSLAPPAVLFVLPTRFLFVSSSQPFPVQNSRSKGHRHPTTTKSWKGRIRNPLNEHSQSQSMVVGSRLSLRIPRHMHGENLHATRRSTSTANGRSTALTAERWRMALRPINQRWLSPSSLVRQLFYVRI